MWDVGVIPDATVEKASSRGRRALRRELDGRGAGQENTQEPAGGDRLHAGGHHVRGRSRTPTRTTPRT